MLMDCLAHLDHLTTRDLQRYIKEAQAKGLCTILNSCQRPSVSEAFLEKHPTINVASANNIRLPQAIGIHPMHAEHADLFKEKNILQKLLKADRLASLSQIIAIGEVGLDARQGMPDKAAQSALLQWHWQVASVMNKPLIVHCVQAYGALRAFLEKQPPQPFVLHQYTGPLQMVAFFKKQGGYFSVNGRLTLQGYDRMREVVKALPQERLLLESDAPDAASIWRPMGHSADLPKILNFLAKLRQEDEKQLSNALWQNSKRFFGGF